MLKIIYSSQFKRDFKKLRNVPLHDLKIIFEVISSLEQELTLDAKYKDHELSGNWSNFRECHIKPDLLLIYKREVAHGCAVMSMDGRYFARSQEGDAIYGAKDGNVSELQLARLGTHTATYFDSM